MPKLKLNTPLPINGLDTSGPSTLIDSRSTPDCKNVRISRSEIKKREGSVGMGASLGEMVVALGEFERESVPFFFRIGQTKFETWTNAIAAWVRRNTSTTLNGSAIIPVDYDVTQIAGLNTLVITNFIDAIQKYTGSGELADLGGTPPLARYMLQSQGYLILANIKDGGVEYPARVQWPDTDDPEEWIAGNAGYQDLTDDQDEITGLASLKGLVVVSKENSIYNAYLTGDDRVFAFEPQEMSISFLVGNTIRNIPGGRLIGLSKYGLITYDGLRSTIIGQGVAQDIKDNINPNHVKRAFGVVLDELNEYHLYIPIGVGAYPTVVYKYNYLTDQIHKDVVTNITAAGFRSMLSAQTWNSVTSTWNGATGIWNNIIPATLYPRLITGDSSGACRRFDYDTLDDSAAIEAYWASKDFFGYDQSEGEVPRLSRWMDMEIDASGNKLDIFYSIDKGETYKFLKTLFLSSEMATFRIPMNILSDSIRFKFENNYSDSTFTLRGFRFWCHPRERAYR